MLVLMTTSNYPDVMLHAYEMNRLNFIYFGGYLMIGLFLILNLLLAIVYNTFKNHFSHCIENLEDVRINYFYEKF